MTESRSACRSIIKTTLSMATIFSGLSFGVPAAFADTSSLAATADKIFAEATAPQLTPPPSTGPAAVHGKTIVNIPCAMGAEGCARPARAVQEAAALIGWKSILIDPAGDPSKMADAVQQAISMKADAIVLSAIDVSTIQGALAQAKQAGIKIVAFASLDKSHILDAAIPSEQSFIDDGYTMGAVAYKLGDDKLQMIEMRGDEFGVVRNRAVGTNKFIKDCQDAGGPCKVLSSQNFLVTDLTSRVPQQAASEVERNPEFNVLWVGYDAGLNFMIQGLQQADLLDHGFAVGFDANVANLSIIRAGGFEHASMGLPLERIGYALVDDLNRMFAGQAIVDPGIHSKILIKSNLPASGPWEGDVAFRDDYKKLWGIQ